MAEIWIPQESFGSGELAPSVHGLVSSDQFQRGCYTLTNALLGPTGSARKRFGTHDIAPTTSGYPAALFLYVHGGRRFVIQFVSQDDDPGDLNTTARQVRVLDAETRAFINFGDGLAHGPFDATADAGYYFHHFTATELDEVYAFQDGQRITFCHKDRHPIYMERETGDSGEEKWRYGLSARDNPPTVFSNRVLGEISEVSSTEIQSSVDRFVPNDVGALWRIGGKEVGTGAQFIYSAWFRTDTWKSPTRMIGARVHGTCGLGISDWTGPYLQGSSFSATISSSSTTGFDSRDFTHTAGAPTVIRNQIGSPFIFNQGGNDTWWIITAVASTTVFTAVRLGGAGTVTGTGTGAIYALGYSDLRFLNRPYLKKHPCYCTGTTGSQTLYCAQSFYDGNAVADDVPWLPDGHETAFDGSRGGVVFLNGGAFAITGTTSGSLEGGRVYTGTVIKDLEHQGPSLQWSIGWSLGTGFPRCGTAHQARTIFGGFEFYPQNIVGSRVGFRDDFTTGANDDDGFLLRLTDPTGGTPTWMESAQDLLIGTTTGEGAIQGAPLTSSSLEWSRQTGYGGENVRPSLVGAAVLFASGHGLREMAFVFDRDRYLAPDLTDLAKHLFTEGIRQIEYLSHPFQTVYVLTASNQMRALSYWRENGVVGWSPFVQPSYPISSGASEEESEIETMAAVRAGGTITNDELWVVRRYKAGGSGGAGTDVRRIEAMSADYTMDQTVTDASPTTTQATSAGVFPIQSGAYAPRILLDGEDIGTYATDISGVATYPTQASTPDTALIGRTIDYTLVPLIQGFVDRGTGSTLGRIKAINAMVLLLNESRGGSVDGRPIDNSLAVLTGWRDIAGGRASSRRIPPLVAITHSNGYHFEVAALNMKVSFG